MTKKNLIIVIILLSVIDLLAAGWYVSRRIEASGKSENLFDQRDSTEVIAMADTVTGASQADLFEKPQHNTYYYIANTPSTPGNNSTRYTSIKHVKVRWPIKVNGNDELTELNKELISKAFGNGQSSMQDARYVYLNTPSFNKPIGDDYKKLTEAPTIVPVYGNVTQVLVYPYMTSQRLLVMEIDKVEYNGNSTSQDKSFIHYDRQRQRVLSRLDILVADVSKENKLLKLINNKIDDLNRGRKGQGQLQHALNVPGEVCCSKDGVFFHFKHGTISNGPVEILLDYDALEPYFAEGFKQMVGYNEGYYLYKNTLKPEPVNQSRGRAVNDAQGASSSVKEKKYSHDNTRRHYHKRSSHHYNHRYWKHDSNSSYRHSRGHHVKGGYRNWKKSSGATHRSGRHGYSGRRH